MDHELKAKLEVVKKNISDLVDYLDENRLMGSIPDPAWKYILAIEEAVADEAVTLEEVYDKYFK